MLMLAEFILLIINAVLLFLEGASDKRIHGIPYKLVLAHAILAIVSTVLRYCYLSIAEFIVVYALVGVLLAVLALLYIFTGLVGEGDIAVIAFSSATTPYVSVGYLSHIPIIAPLAIVISATYLAYKYSRTTRTVYLSGVGKVRARVRYAVDFKRGLLRDEVPIYIDGHGSIPIKTRKNPEHLKKFIDVVPDYAIVYSVPNYPYIYYYSASFIFTYSLLLMISLLVDIVVS